MRKLSFWLIMLLAFLLALPKVMNALASGKEKEGSSIPGQSSPQSRDANGVSQEDYTLLDGFVLATLNSTMAIQVPSGWDNKAGSGGSTVIYSPADSSGAISSSSGTLTTTWYAPDGSGSGILEKYVDNLRKANIYSDVTSSPVIVAGQDGISLSYKMTVGTDSFSCRSACFVYDDILYSIEMFQGSESREDYFPIFEEVIGTAAIMAGKWETAQRESGPVEPEPAPSEPEYGREVPDPGEPAPEPEAPEPAVPEPIQPEPTLIPREPIFPTGDLGDFTYAINGHPYQFPTDMSAFIAGDLDIDNTLVLSSERSGDALANTLYFALAHIPSLELIGVSNLTGKNAPMTAGLLTALVDTQSSAIDLELPRGICVGSAESSIVDAFPEFAGMPMDGVADFRGNELIFACNVRDDGCNGYVLIRNDAYCSALSIICEDGVIREINFQSLGENLAVLFE
ncbi:MAG: hypothetical protein J5859_01125 [Clostridia bacterium]|nr:hypothetical protein [Clostridia bacterium]